VSIRSLLGLARTADTDRLVDTLNQPVEERGVYELGQGIADAVRLIRRD